MLDIDIKFRLAHFLQLPETKMEIIDNEKKEVHGGCWRDFSISMGGKEVAIICIDTEFSLACF